MARPLEHPMTFNLRITESERMIVHQAASYLGVSMSEIVRLCINCILKDPESNPVLQEIRFKRMGELTAEIEELEKKLGDAKKILMAVSDGQGDAE